MRFLSAVMAVLLILTMSTGAFAKAHKKAMSKTQDKKADKKYGTDFNFNDLLVRGEYLQPAEAAATVEDEKTLDDLLQVRKDFKDRLKQSSTKR